MSAPRANDKACKVAIFDSYSKTVMKNIRQNLVYARNNQKEMMGTENMQYLFDEQVVEDTYPSEHLSADGKGPVCVITTEWLQQVMEQLPEKQKEVLIYEFWYGMKVGEIAKKQKVSERTIYSWKQLAFQTIREHYERNIQWEKPNLPMT